MRVRLDEIKRQRKLASLTATLIASGVPVFAGDPVTPPSAPTPQIQARILANPFCELPKVVTPTDVLLASDVQHGGLRLKPIGAAVGLRNIGDPDAPPPQLITVDVPPAPEIQHNPLVGNLKSNSLIHDVPVMDVVESEQGGKSLAKPEPAVPVAAQDEPSFTAETSPPSAVANLTTAATQSTISSRPKPITIDAPGNSIKSDIAEPNEIDLAESPTPYLLPLSNPNQDDLTKDELVTSNSVHYSLSDDSDASDPSGLVDIALPVRIEESQDSVPLLAKAPQLRPLPGKVHEPAPVHLRIDEKLAYSSMVSNENRHRPPVAVSPPSRAIESPSQSENDVLLVRPKVIRVAEAAMPNLPLSAELEGAKAVQKSPEVDLYLSKAQVRTLAIGGELRQVNVDNQAICQVVQASANEMKLIGTGNGVTRLTVWGDDAKSGLPKVRVFRIHVEPKVEGPSQSVSETTDTLNQSIARAFPHSRVLVHRDKDQLLVRGVCDSNDTATQIMRMIRKTCLVPVVDELVIR